MSEAQTEQSRAAHLVWCKKRAIEYAESGDLMNAVTSMISDLRKHPAWEGNPILGTMMMVGMMDAQSGNGPAVRRWIEGWN